MAFGCTVAHALSTFSRSRRMVATRHSYTAPSTPEDMSLREGEPQRTGADRLFLVCVRACAAHYFLPPVLC